MDIKFSKFDTLESLIIKTIEEQLKKLVLIPKAEVRDELSIDEVSKLMPTKTIIDEDYTENIEKTTYEETTLDFDVAEENTLYEDEQEKTYRIKKMIPKGIVYLTYIVAENEDGMYIIDQHAAAERINYEKVLKEITQEHKQIFDLLIPIKVELPSNEYLILKKNIDTLTNMGFNIEEFGHNTVVVRSHPTWIKEGYEEEDIRKVIDIIISEDKFDLERFVWRISATQACRMSIKANDYINKEDQEYLLEELRKCDNPFTCPHGRPTIITYTKYDLEKMFKRSLD